MDSALWNRGIGTGSLPAWQLQRLGFPLSVNADQLYDTRQPESTIPVRSLCALAVAQAGRVSMDGDSDTKIPRLPAFIQLNEFPPPCTGSLCEVEAQ